LVLEDALESAEVISVVSGAAVSLVSILAMQEWRPTFLPSHTLVEEVVEEVAISHVHWRYDEPLQTVFAPQFFGDSVEAPALSARLEEASCLMANHAEQSFGTE